MTCYFFGDSLRATMGDSFKKIIAVILAIAFLVLAGQSVLAKPEKPVAIKISPLFLKYSLKRGEQAIGRVSVTNPNRFKINVQSEVEDFIQGDEIGTPQFLPQGAGITSLASGIKFSLDQFILAPLETKDISFTINIPKDAEPGGHYAALFFKMLPQKRNGRTQLSVGGRAGTLVLVSVPGKVSQAGAIVEFSGPKLVNKGPVKFLVRFKNTGTVHYQPKGLIKISSTFNRKPASIKLDEHFVLPKSIRRYEPKWNTGYGFGIYRATLEIKDGRGRKLTKSLRFVIFPSKEALVVLGISLLIYASTSFFKSRYKITKK